MKPLKTNSIDMATFPWLFLVSLCGCSLLQVQAVWIAWRVCYIAQLFASAKPSLKVNNKVVPSGEYF